MYMGKKALCKNAKCPFFKSEYHSSITCEETEFRITFPSDEKRDAYAEKYCMREFPEGCPVHDGIRARYE
jgi:hypothetical protein